MILMPRLQVIYTKIILFAFWEAAEKCDKDEMGQIVYIRFDEGLSFLPVRFLCNIPSLVYIKLICSDII